MPSSNLNFPPLTPVVSARFDRILSGKQPMMITERGPAVAVVQQALIGLGFKVVADGSFGPKTQTAVKSFQGANSQQLGKADGIVGPLTLGGLFGSVFVDVQPINDFVIYFEGNEPSVIMAPNEVIEVSGLTPDFSQKRRLTRMGFRTTNINGLFATTSFIAVTQALLTTQAAGLLGRIYIFGASAGGRLAIALAEKLTSANTRLRFVAITDAALFQDGSITNPKSLGDDLPTFFKALIVAEIKLNYFHRLGNSVRRRANLAPPLLWSSSMDNNEVHGEVAGFTNLDRDLSADVKAKSGLLSTDLKQHIECNRIALAKIRAKVIADLNSNI